MKIDRKAVREKYDGKCAYCGCELPEKGFHVDHIIPKNRYSDVHQCLIVRGEKFTEYDVNDILNLNPSCRRCNLWKSTHSIDEFRAEISAQRERLEKYNANFRLAVDYGIVTVTAKTVTFHFELIDW